MVEKLEGFIIDADVLIDYRDSDINVLGLFSKKVGPLYIGRATFQKIKRVSEAEARRQSMVVITPGLGLAVAASQGRGKLSYDDHETLLLAAQNNWNCISNDNALRTECSQEAVNVLWGLEPMKYLVKVNSLSLNKALSVAKLIQKSNPDYITDDILKRFDEQLREILT